MSDYDEFDAFDVDESFLREVEEVEKRAAAPPPPPRRPNAGAAARAAALIAFADPDAGPSRRAAVLGVRPPAPPSDDYDMSFDLDPAALAQIDSVASAARARPRLANGTTLLPTTNRDKFARTTSGSAMFQTHLGFRRQQQHTKGKRWDRTAFAASGRRVAAEKEKKEGRKKKGKRKRGEEDDEDEDEDEDEEDWGEPLAPPPKPLVDICELGVRYPQLTA